MRISDWISVMCSSYLQQGEAADQAELLRQHGEDEIGLLFRQEVQVALSALHEAFAGEGAGAEADHRLQRVIAGAQRVVLRIEERQHSVLLVVVQELPDDRPRCQPGGDRKSTRLNYSH